MKDLELARQIAEEIWTEITTPALCFRLDEGEPGLFDSKVGGTPYLPRGASWPLDRDGKAMGLLAQVNCADLAPLPDFPHTGLLQFFIALDDVFGMDFDDMTNPSGFQVLYHETVDGSITAEDVEALRPAFPDDADSPVFVPCRIRFGPVARQKLAECDYLFNAAFLQRWNARCPDAPLTEKWRLYKGHDGDECEALFQQPGLEPPYHQCGGYPYFTQDDPRRSGRYDDLDVLLFQLDSDAAGKKDLVLWGDCGVCNFFINREALRKCDFSRVGYNWDCC